MNDAIAGLVGALIGSAATAVGALAQARGAHAQARAAQDAADAGQAQWARESQRNAWFAFHDVSRELESQIFSFAVYMRAVHSESPLSPDVWARKGCRESVQAMLQSMRKLNEAREIIKLHGHGEVTAAAEGVSRACASFVRGARSWVDLRMRHEDSMVPWDDRRHAVKQARSRFEETVANANRTTSSSSSPSP